MRLISVVVFRFRQKGVKLSRSGVSLKLAVPSGCIEFRKPAPELRQVRGGESFDSLLQGFHIGHGLSVRFTAHQSDANRLASPPPSNRQRRCTAKQQPGSHAAGISRSSRFPWSAAPRGLESEPVLVPRSMPVGSPEPAEDGGLTPLQC